ncbi:MAG: pyruvate formate lyase family protein, partial [Thermodesulfobacteriota bacterium]|nr:pyruvate formate lyase family protein [Thermodesulfobacteriota bacterium]
AEICDWVPGNPARTLHEALQCINFVHFVVTFIELPLVGWGIRLDKCCGQFYDDDIQAGRITRDQAQELVECLFVKNQETGYLHSPLWSGFGGGALGYQTLNIGGMDSSGKDITNEISYIVLDAMQAIRTVTPPLALRYHDGTPKKLVERAIEVIASGMPQPAFFNDKVTIPRLVELGASIQDARNYSINNCMVPIISGKNRNHPSAWLNGIGLAGCLNEALGIEPLPGYFKRQGHKMEAPEKVTSVEELIDATIENFAWLTQRLVKMGNIMDAVYKEFAPRPLLSALTDGCIDRAQDGREWIEKPDYRDLIALGLNNTADSLAAIKKLVFDEKKVSMETMIEALKNNWEGYEDLQEMCLAAPKFGNDIDEVDAISAELGKRIKEETSKLKTNWGTSVIPDGTSGTVHYLFGSTCAATADGRKAKETFHDGSVSPMGGRDNKGPTAVLNSVSKVNPLNTWNHLFNQSFMPEHVTGRNAELFAQYIKTWADLGIHHVQFSAVGKDTLVDAQEHPSENANLLVRVAGYAAYFVDLSKIVQDQIISRTPQAFSGPSC